MKTLHSLNDLQATRRPILLAVGFFDGVHRGHQNLIRRAVRASRQGLGETWIMTFDPHPRKVLSPASAPALLTSTSHKLRILESLGATGCVVAPFTTAYAHLEPETFIASLASSVPTLSRIFIGQNWTFGRHRRGNAALLKILAGNYGFQVVTIPPVCWRGQPVSSTRIRGAVACGRLSDAARMLGRPFSILGTVIPGRQIGRTLGIPTANLDPHNEVHPPSGVYAVMAMINGKHYLGVANLGTQPTIGRRRPKTPILELHVLDLRRNLYGKNIEILFLKRLRAERKFASREALRAQILRDIDCSRHWLRHRG
ncbi:MAG: bifunctional riboflavin kinase/FAD synthetase [Verrucomicrobia bacterium]|nr:bifunctional riboflavin kinase/FAD synthetase [Verrucomicrobiota bacterium]MBU4290670.1 bifunctional riboflavin kinase/FAD synthetase [Verrucomicrobiota bacterium]MBU4430366.1 bifunctional riboflavin kinase/FAD synthetase [Verrucomicrobiota bacterium]MCG2681149.1 bifunctional riboflavin kinase/FAD synthetase [Kiritimatiellia bacterium]